MEIFDKLKTNDVDVVCATKNHGNLQRIPVAIETTLIDQHQSYDEVSLCATKTCGNLRRKFVAIAMVDKMQFFSDETKKKKLLFVSKKIVPIRKYIITN